MKKIVLTMFMTAFLAHAPAFSADVSPEQALQIAKDFTKNASSLKHMPGFPRQNDLRIRYASQSRAGGVNYYIVAPEKSQGYIIVAGDDRLPSVLGYSATGDLDSSSLPINLEGMLHYYDSEIELLKAGKGSIVLHAANHQAVAPLLGEIAWDQTAPFNNNCPTIDGTRSITGCVATAMAQVMFYHKWPETGAGSVSYTTTEENLDIAVDFEGFQYNWDAMTPTYDSSSTQESKDAVATLMYHVGASIHSQYEETGTGASNIDVAPALIDNFRYDQGIDMQLRNYTTQERWESLLLAELDAQRPVLYGGVTRKKEGHFFVVDGYDGEGYFHVNWGWSGRSNGYYLLNILNPESQGSGAGTDGLAYSYNQVMLLGVQKPIEGSQRSHTITVDGLEEVSKTVARSGSVTLQANGVYNNSTQTMYDVKAGFALVDEEGNIVYSNMFKTWERLRLDYGNSKLSTSFVIPEEIEAGNYTVKFVYTLGTEEHAIYHYAPVQTGQIQYYTATVTDENIVYGFPAPVALTITSVEGDTEVIESGKTSTVRLKVRNDGEEYFGPVNLKFFISGMSRVYGTNYALSNPMHVALPAHSETEIEFPYTLNLPAHDNYVLQLVEHQGTKGYASKAQIKGVKIIGPKLPAVLELSADPIITTATEGVVPLNNIELKISVDNLGEEWTGQLRAKIVDPEYDPWSSGAYLRNGGTVAYVTFDPVTIAGDGESWVTLTGGEATPIEEPLTLGKTYDFKFLEDGSDDTMNPSEYNKLEIVFGEAIEKNAILSLEGLEAPSPIQAGKESNFVFNVKNDGYAYDGTACFHITKGEETLFRSEYNTLKVDRNSSSSVAFTETLELPTYDNYVAVLYDDKGTEIGRQENLKAQADEPVLLLESLTASPTTFESGETVEVNATVKNEGFAYENEVYAAIGESSSDAIYFSFEPQLLSLARNGTQTLIFKSPVDITHFGELAVMLLEKDGKCIGNPIVINAKTGIEEMSTNGKCVITSDYLTYDSSDIENISIFDISGRKVISSGVNSVYIGNLNPGVYTSLIKTKETVRTVKFLVK